MGRNPMDGAGRIDAGFRLPVGRNPRARAGATSVLFNLVPVAALLIAAGFGRMP